METVIKGQVIFSSTNNSKIINIESLLIIVATM